MSILTDLTFEIYQILKSYGKEIILYDSNGNETYDSKDATRMFVKPEGMLFSFITKDDDSDEDINEIKIYISNDVDMEKILKLITTIRHTAVRFGFILTIKKYGKSVTPKDFILGKLKESKASKLYGGDDTSYQDIGNIRLVIEHNGIVNNVFGSRSRNIKNIFLENLASNERFNLRSSNLRFARAMANHLNMNGNFNDKIFCFARNLSEEYDALKKLKIESRKYNQDIVPSINRRLNEIKASFSILTGSRNYKKYYNLFGNQKSKSEVFEDLGDVYPVDISYASKWYGNLNKASNYPVVKINNNQKIFQDLLKLNNFKSYIDYDINDDEAIIYTPDCFSILLNQLEEFDVPYELKLKEEENMTQETYPIGFSFPTTNERDSVLRNLEDDFSYDADEVFPVNNLMIGFQSKDIFNELKNYIDVLSPHAKEASIVPNDVDTEENVTEDSYPSLFEELSSFIKSYDPDVFLKEGSSIAGFDDETNAILNSPELFNKIEFDKTLSGNESSVDIIKKLQDYLYNKVVDVNPNLNLDPNDFKTTASGIFYRYYKKASNVTEQVIKIIQEMDISNFSNIDSYIKSKLKEDYNYDASIEEIGLITEKYKDILQPISESDVVTQDMVIKPGTRVMTPWGKGNVLSKKIVKKNKSTSWIVQLDNGMEKSFSDIDVIPINKQTDKAFVKTRNELEPNDQIKSRFGLQPDGSIVKSGPAIKEEDEYEDVTIDDLVDEFLNDADFGGYLIKIGDKTGSIDESFIDDRIIGFLIKNKITYDDELFNDIKTAIIKSLTEKGYNIVQDVNEDKPDGNFQTSLLSDIESDRVYNPHEHDFNSNVDTDQKGMIARLQALAGLTRLS